MKNQTQEITADTQLQEIIANIQPVSLVWRQKAKQYLGQLASPPGSLGDLLKLAEQLAAIQETIKPSVKKKAVVTMAGDHGVVEEKVSAFPQEVTPQMVDNFVKGGAAINVLAGVAGAKVIVVDMGVASDLTYLAEQGKIMSCRLGNGTSNMASGPAMSRSQAEKSLLSGIEIARQLINEGTTLLATGDMGIGNTTSSSAIAAVLTGYSAGKVTGKGTGITDKALENKVRVIEKAILVNKPNANDPIDVLAKVGGFEIGGIAGLILGAAYYKVPIVVDGFISTAGALLAAALAPNSKDYMIASHCSVERGHIIMLEKLGLRPLLNLNLRLGEGTGAALAMTIVEGAAQIMCKMLTFEAAGVSSSDEADRV